MHRPPRIWHPVFQLTSCAVSYEPFPPANINMSEKYFITWSKSTDMILSVRLAYLFPFSPPTEEEKCLTSIVRVLFIIIEIWFHHVCIRGDDIFCKFSYVHCATEISNDEYGRIHLITIMSESIWMMQGDYMVSSARFYPLIGRS